MNVSEAIRPPDLSRIIPPDSIGGFSLALTVFILGSIFFALFGWFLFVYIFGQPMKVSSASSGGWTMIQHFNTPKSGIFKRAKVGGGAFQYESIRDGTVAAIPDSVLRVLDRQLVITFAQFGMSIPMKILGAVSILVANGINNLKDLKQKYVKIVVESYEDGTSKVFEKLENDETIAKSYDFDNFDKILNESKNEKLIPLVVEAVPEFVEKNISADYNEVKLTYAKRLNVLNIGGDNSTFKLLGIVIIIVLLVLVSTVVK